MNKLIFPLAIVISITLIGALGYMGIFDGIFGNYKITQINTFTADDNSFSFNYPEFKGWEVFDIKKRFGSSQDANESIVDITLNRPGPLVNMPAPIIFVIKSNKLAKLSSDTPRNPNGIYYYGYNDSPQPNITFQAPSFSVEISVNGTSSDFPGKRFADEVTKTFKVSKTSSGK